MRIPEINIKIPPRILAAIGILCLCTQVLAGSIDYTAVFDVSKFDSSGITLYGDRQYSILKWDGLEECQDVGAPNIPETVVTLLVPTLSNNFSVSVSGTSTKTESLQYSVCPVMPPIPISKIYEGYTPPIIEPDKGKYSKSASLNADVISEDIIAGIYHIVRIRISPIAYNDFTNTLDIYSKLDIVLNYSDCSAEEMPLECDLLQHHKLPFPLEHIVDNPEDEYRMLGRARVAARNTQVEEVDEYLVIGPYYSYEALKPLLDWKAQKGYSVVFAPIENIYAQYTSAKDPDIIDDAASLRAYIKDRYHNCSGDLYCLLVGTPGKTKMPLRYYTNVSLIHSTDTTIINGMNFTPTDLYFGNVTYNWPLVWNTHNNCYVIPWESANTVNLHTPDVVIGRLLCTDNQEISNYIEKLFLYESNPGYGDNEYLNNAFVFEQDAYTSLINKASDVITELSKHYHTTLFQDNKSDGIVWPEGKDVLNQMRVSGYNSWYGHGAPNHVAVSAGNQNPAKSEDFREWRGLTAQESYTEKVINGGDLTPLVCYEHQGLDLLDNINYPSIVYSISCDNAPMDVFMGDNGNNLYDAKYNMASAFTVAGLYGGVAFLGNCRAGLVYSSPPVEKNFIKGLSINPCIGKAQMYSKFYHATDNKTTAHVLHTHYLCGEPEFSVWLGKPKDSNASIVWNGDYIDISAPELIGAKVVEFSGTGEYEVSQMTSSLISITGCQSKLYPLAPFTAYGIWKDGYLPIVELRHMNGRIGKGNFRFIVRRTVLGSSNDVYNGRITMLSLEDDVKLNVWTIDELHLDFGFIMKGNASFTSDRQRIANIHNCKIADNANLSVKGEGTIIGSGFCIQKGATMSILPK